MPADPVRDSRPASARTQDWRQLLAVYCITSLVEAIGVSQIFAFLPLRLREVHLPPDQIPAFTGIFTALIFVVGIFLVPFWGVWADRISRRAVIVRSAVVEAIVFAGVALAAEPWQLAAALLLTGLQLGNTGVMLAALRDVSPMGRIATVSAVFGATGQVGFALGPAVGGLAVDQLQMPLTAVFWSSSLLSVGIVVLLMAASRDVRPRVVPQGSSIALAAAAVRGALADRPVRRIFLIFGVAILGSQMTRPYLPLLVEALTGNGPGLASAIALVVGTAALIGALVSPASGPLGDRLGLRTVLIGSLVLAGLGVSFMPMARGVVALAGLAVIFAAAYAAVQAMVFALLAVEVPAERRSATLNLVLLPLYVAGIVGPTIAAGFAAALGVGAVYPAAGAAMVGSAVLIGMLDRRRTMPPEGGG